MYLSRAAKGRMRPPTFLVESLLVFCRFVSKWQRAGLRNSFPLSTQGNQRYLARGGKAAAFALPLIFYYLFQDGLNLDVLSISGAVTQTDSSSLVPAATSN